MMRQILIYIFLFLPFISFATPQNKNEAFNASKLAYYNKGGWTITNNYGYLFMDSVEYDVPLDKYDILLEVNGIDVTQLNSLDELHNQISQSKRVTLKYISTKDRKEHSFSYTPINLNLKGYNEIWSYSFGILGHSWGNRDALNVDVMSDDDVDFKNYHTIDVFSNDLKGKEIAMQALNTLLEYSPFPIIRDKESPDLLLSVDFSESHSSPTTSYHEFCIKISDAKTRKVVWQLTYNKSYDYYIDLATILDWFVLPGNLCYFPKTVGLFYPFRWYSGICWKTGTNKSIIADIMKNSPAKRMGLLPGDEIIKIDGKKELYQAWENVFFNGKVDSYYSKSREELSFKNRPYYEAIDLRYISTGVSYRHNQWFDLRIYYPFPMKKGEKYPVVEVEIKRNGKKMKLKGALYGETYLHGE